MTIYAATGNAGKLQEFSESANGSSANGEAITVLALPGLAAMPEPVEDAATFSANADLKAVAYSLLAPRLLVFADDSGLEVDVLGGEPGVRSARYADDAGYATHLDNAKDHRNNALLLERLAHANSAARSARFVCALSLAKDGEVLLRAMGSCEGEILDTPRGRGGFGYDPLFLLPDLGLTTAELPREQKWLLSHRGNAFRSLLEQLKTSPL